MKYHHVYAYLKAPLRLLINSRFQWGKDNNLLTRKTSLFNIKTPYVDNYVYIWLINKYLDTIYTYPQ